MHNFIKKTLVIIAAAGLCASCGKSVKIKGVDKSYSTNTISVKACIPQIDGLASRELQEKLNKEYMTVCTDMLNDFSKSAKETNEQSFFEISTTEHYNRSGFLSVVTQVESSAKRSRKNSFRITKNIDTNSCVEVSFSELFADDSYIDMLNEYLEQEITQHSERYTDLWEKPKISEGQRFYINEDNLVIFYPPYELSYYERGFVEISVPLSDISGYLKPEYRNMFIN